MAINKYFSIFLAASVFCASGISLDKFAHRVLAKQPALSKSDFLDTVRLFKSTQKESLHNLCWLNNRKLTHINPGDAKFESFAQKVIVEDGSQAAFWGDLHGSIESLLNCLLYLKKIDVIDDDLKIASDNFYMFFLGDFVDRLPNGIEVLYLIVTLKMQNPSRVFLVRGNHEDASLNYHYGFLNELMSKYPDLSHAEILEIFDMYNFMPAVIYLGKKTNSIFEFIHCCHGGLEIGFNPKCLLSSENDAQIISELTRKSECAYLLQKNILNNIPNSEIMDFKLKSASELGLLWNDFCCNDKEPAGFIRGRGWKISKELSDNILELQSSENYKIKAIFRAHQHHGEMLDMLIKNRGIVILHNNSVTTFLSARINGLNYDSFGILNIENNFKSWQLNHIVLN